MEKDSKAESRHWKVQVLRLERLAARLEEHGAIARQHPGGASVEKQAGELIDDARAVRWALAEISTLRHESRYRKAIIEAIRGPVP